MNIENIKLAIQVMGRAEKHDSVNMCSFQSRKSWKEEYYCKTEEQLHACGNKACFAGHLAVSPEFQKLGVFVNEWGGVSFGSNDDAEALMFLLGIDANIAESLIYGDIDEDERYSVFYGKVWDEVTARDVINKLEELINESSNTIS